MVVTQRTYHGFNLLRLCIGVRSPEQSFYAMTSLDKHLDEGPSDEAIRAGYRDPQRLLLPLADAAHASAGRVVAGDRIERALP